MISDYFIFDNRKEEIQKYQKLKQKLNKKLIQLKLRAFIPLINDHIKMHYQNKHIQNEIYKFLALVPNSDQYQSEKIIVNQQIDYQKSRNTTDIQILWQFYKLMLLCDLLGILEILYFDSRAIIEYMERYYRTLHWCNDKPLQIINKILKQTLLKQKPKQLLEMVISLHWEIKEDSISILNLEHTSALKKYRRIANLMKEIHLIIFKENLQLINYNPLMNNYQNRFLKLCYQSTHDFKLMMIDLNILLEFEVATYKKYEKTSPNSSIKSTILQNPVEDIYQSQQTLFKDLKQKIDKNGKLYSQLTKLIQIFQVTKFNINSQNLFEILQLLKFNIIKYTFINIKIRPDQPNIIFYLTQIQLFKTPILIAIWKKFAQKMSNITQMFNRGKIKIKSEHFTMYYLKLVSGDRPYEDKLAIDSNETKDKINQIIKFIEIELFGYSELLLVGFICETWLKHAEITPSKKSILLGKTKVGKSSLLRFITGDHTIKVGNSLESQTFYPRKIIFKTLKDNNQFWDLPGLQDNRERIFKLCTGYFLRILSENSPIKIFYLISNYSNFYQNIDNYVDLIYLLGEILSWNPTNLIAVDFIFSYVKGRKKQQLKQYDEQYQRLSKYNQELLEQKLNQRNANSIHIHQFHHSLLQRLKKENIQFFYKKDIQQVIEVESDVSDQQEYIKKQKKRQKTSRQLLTNKLIQMDPRITINVHPLAYIREQGIFLDQFNIYNKTKNYLNSDTFLQNQKLFLKLFHSLKYFKNIRDNEIKEEFDKFNKNFQIEFNEIQQSFYILNTITMSSINKDSLKQNIMNIFYKSLAIFFQNKKQGINNLRNECGFLFQYIGKLSKLKKSTFQQKLKAEIIAYEQQLLASTFKYKQILSKHYQDISEKLNELYFVISEKQIEYNVIKLIQEETIKNQFNQDTVLLIEHLLILMSRENYEKIYLLHHKYQTLDLKGVSQLVQFLRINFYGEGIYKKIRMSEFLKFNSFITNRNQKSRKYIFSEMDTIKLFAEELIIDLEEIYIECKESIYIYTKKITFNIPNDSPCIFTVSNFQGQPTSVVIKSFENYPQQKLIFKSYIIKQKFDCIINKFQNFPKQEKSNEKLLKKEQNRLIEKIKKEGRIVSRTRQQNSTLTEVEYLEKVIYEPPISYIQKACVSNKRISIIYRVNSSKKLLEFGTLHLKYLIIRNLPKGNVRITPDKVLKLSQKIITYIIQKFQKTTMRINQNHFTTNYCQVLAMITRDFILNSKNNMQESNYEERLLHLCYKAMKRQIFTLLFKNIAKRIEFDLNKRFGRYYATRKIQDEIIYIKIYCDNLLKLPYQVMFDYQHSELNHQIRRISKIINFRFKNLLYCNLDQQIEISRYFSSLFQRLFTFNQTEIQKLIQVNEEEYLDNLISKLDEDYKNCLTDHKIYEQLIVRHDRYNSQIKESFCQSPQYTADFLDQSKIRERIMRLFQLKQYNEMKILYSSFKQLFQKKQDIIHEYIGYCMIKRNMFENARRHALFVSEESKINFSILFNVLNAKYNTIFRRSTQEDNKQSLNLKNCISELKSYLKIIDRNEDSEQNISNFKLRNYQSSGQHYNVLSFDSATFNPASAIINVAFAAEIQKTTHRPIMHMFNIIAGKTTSSIIASALTIPQSTQQHFEQSITPQFLAYEFLDKYPQIIKKFESEYQYKNRYKRLTFKDVLPMQLQIIKNFNKSNKKQKQYFLQTEGIFQSVVSAINSYNVNQKHDPLQDYFEPRPYANQTIHVLSLGTGTNIHARSQSQHKIQIIEKPNYIHEKDKYEKWQIFFDEDTDKLKSKPISYFLDQVKIDLQERWINDTKRMRDLMDRLEDRPILRNLGT